jgi:hypothetical protein
MQNHCQDGCRVKKADKQSLAFFYPSVNESNCHILLHPQTTPGGKRAGFSLYIKALEI